MLIIALSQCAAAADCLACHVARLLLAWRGEDDGYHSSSMQR
jgi:hypothetical protein